MANRGPVSRRRRRANAVQGQRRHRVVIRHNDAEMARLQQLAAEEGITLQRLYVRALTTGDAETAARLARLRDELGAARRLLAAVSNNVNQLAMVANSTGELAPELESTLAAVRRVADRIGTVVDRVGESSG